MKLQGKAVSGGVAIAPAFVYEPFTPVIDEAHITAAETEAAVTLFESSRAAVTKELEEICAGFTGSDCADMADILRAHIELLNDEAVSDEVTRRVREELAEPKYAIDETFNLFAAMMASLDEPLMRERAADFLDVKCRLLCKCLGVRRATLRDIGAPSVIFAHDLLPSDTATLNRSMVAGIVTEIGGMTSHSAIIARSYGIPAVLGAPGVMAAVGHDALAIVDGDAGEVVLAPDAAEMAAYTEKKAAFEKRQATVQTFAGAVPVTTDGKRIRVCLNIGSADKNELADADKADGVGLFRTEFLYMQSNELPDEETQFQAYRRVAEAFSGKQVILRTLDIGGDKTLSCMDLPHEENPFLGVRALRLCFAYPALFMTQLRAILRASAYGNLAIMFPMVGTIEGFRRAKAFLEEAKADLRREAIPFSETVPVGVMVEIPSLAVMADAIAEEADFASIGTNDLCQYVLAADRLNPGVAPYYQFFNPAVFRLISHVAKAFSEAGKPLSVCGEMGGNPLAAAVLIGMGIHKLSMSFPCVPAVKQMITGIRSADAEQLAQTVLQQKTAAEVETCIRAAVGSIIA